MKGKSQLIPTVLLLIAGIALIALHSDVKILEGIVVFLGIMFIIPSIVYGGIVFAQREEVYDYREDRMKKVIPRACWPGLVASVFGLILGIVMVCAPGVFARFISYLFGSLLVLVGIYHLLSVAMWSKPYVLPAYFYIIPVVLIVAGVVILFTNVRTLDSIFVLVTGIGMVLSAVGTMMEYIATHPTNRKEGDTANKNGEEPKKEKEEKAKEGDRVLPKHREDDREHHGGTMGFE